MPRFSNSAFAEKFPNAFAALKKARGDVFPSFAAGVLHNDVFTSAFEGCDDESLFDLASLTKVLSMGTLSVIAEQRGIWKTDEAVQKYVPKFPDPRVKLSHLLNHTSGLAAWLPLHQDFHDADSPGSFDFRSTPALARIRYEEKIISSYDPSAFEKAAVYSDLGFLLLGWALERATDMPIDALFQEWIALPTGLKSLQYLPISPNVVPTENCPWRGRVLRGEVHDDNCYVLGGVAAHAGLFGNLNEVVTMGSFWLESFLGEHETFESGFILPQSLTKKYWTESHLPYPACTRYLAWDSPSAENSSSGHQMSLKARGHLGFTGTSLWIDPEKNLVIALLTNRVHPSRANEKIRAFRPVFHDAVVHDLKGGLK